MAFVEWLKKTASTQVIIRSHTIFFNNPGKDYLEEVVRIQALTIREQKPSSDFKLPKHNLFLMRYAEGKPLNTGFEKGITRSSIECAPLLETNLPRIFNEWETEHPLWLAPLQSVATQNSFELDEEPAEPLSFNLMMHLSIMFGRALEQLRSDLDEELRQTLYHRFGGYLNSNWRQWQKNLNAIAYI
jgi:hypothetical protein